MAARIAINGFGRIGRCVARLILSGHASGVELVAINDLTDARALAYLLEFDSVHGRFRGSVAFEDGHLVVGERRIRVLAEREPARLPWRELGVDVVLECTGEFRSRAAASAHVDAGARRVIISAPPDDPVDAVFCVGLNQDRFDPGRHFVVSNASCTTNCVAPVLKVLDDGLGVRKAHMLTVHSYTNDQAIVDQPHHSDYRRGRAAAESMVPTSSGVSKALFSILPSMKGRFAASSIRVPTPDVSIVCLTAQVGRGTTVEELHDLFRNAAAGPLAGVLGVETRPLVSADYLGDTRSAVVDANLTDVVDGDLVEVHAWYDNEWGYSARMVDLVRVLAKGG